MQGAYCSKPLAVAQWTLLPHLVKAILPHAAPSQCLGAARRPRQCRYWGTHDFGQLWPQLSLIEPRTNFLRTAPHSQVLPRHLSAVPHPLLGVRPAFWSDSSPSLLASSSFSLPGICANQFLIVSPCLRVCFTEDPGYPHLKMLGTVTGSAENTPTAQGR